MVKLVNRAKMTTATTGTGTITLSSASDGHQTFAAAGVSNGDEVRYAIEDGSGFELGVGQYTSSGTTLSRSVTESSNSNNALNLSGNAVVFVTAIADDVGVRTYATISAMTSATAAKSGALAYVTANTGLYQNNGNGWYKIATVNTSPTISSVQDASSGTTPFALATDGTATVITITAADVDEGTTLNYSYTVSTGSLTNGGGATATVKDASNNTLAAGTAYTTNVFKVVPTTTEAHAGSFSLTFNVTDNINTAQSVNAFTLSFITTIPNSRYTVLLAEGQGAGDNSTFDDASTNNHTLTKQRSSTSIDYPVANSFSPYRYGGYSVEFQGTNQSLRTHSFPTGVYLGTENFSMEFWVKTPSLTTTNKIIDQQTNNGSLEFHLLSNRVASLYINNTGFDFPNSSAFEINKWHHVAVTKNSSFVKGFVNGTEVKSTTITNSGLSTTDHISLGGQHNFNTTVEKGLKMHDLRIVKGYVLHVNNSGTNTYPVPTAPLEEVTGTFLTAYRLPYLAYKRQTSASDATLVIENMDHIQGSNSSGPPATVPDTPYDGDENTSGTGSSVYFPENGYIDIASSFSGTNFNGNFTCEFWIYLTEKFYTAETTIFAMTGGTIAQVKIDANQYLSGFKQQARNSEKLPTRCWNHVVMSRSGSTINFYVNGERMQRSEGSTFNGNSSSKIGARIDGSTRLKNAYISDFRLTAATALYTASSIVPPTEPLNTPSGTSLHMKGNDGAIVDKNASSELLLKPRSGSGQPAGDTTDVVYNSSTIYSNCFSMTGGGSSGVETGEYIQVPNMTKLEGTEDFTVEAWIYPTNIGSYQFIFDHGNFGFSLGQYNSNNIFYCKVNGGFTEGVGGAAAYGTYSIPNNQWSFVQMVRDSGVFKCYHNGTLRWIANESQHQSSSVTTTNIPAIGATSSGGERFKGKIQGLRVSKGLVRPTTVPTTSFKG